MNLLCPVCQKMLTVPDQHAGQVMQCPLCGNTFTAPALAPVTETAVPSPPVGPTTAPAPGAPASSPGAVKEEIYGLRDPVIPRAAPPLPPPPPPPMPKRSKEKAPPPPPAPAPPAVLLPGYQKVVTIWAGPRVVPWLAPVALFLVFLTMYGTWITDPHSKNPDDFQTGWGTAFGTNYSGLGVLFFLFYFMAFVLAIGRVVLPRVAENFPPWLEQLIRMGSAIIAGLALLSLFFLFLEVFLGFGLEQDRFLRRTMWLGLAFVFELVGIIGAALEFWLTVRKSKPLPRVDISW